MVMAESKAQQPVLLITGASAGIGAAIARRFAAGGYRIVAVARGKDKLAALARELAPQTAVATLAADVTATDSGDRAVELAMKNFGRLDCLINNAGSGKWAPVRETDDATLDEVIDTSMKAPFRFCRAALKVMKPGASIINIGSTFGIHGGLNGGAYCMAKAGLIGLTQTMAAQYGEGGIRANLIAPTVIKTDMTKDFWDYPFFQRINQEMTPAPRDCTVDDVAHYAFFIASEQGSYINGQTLALDGGWSTTKYLVEHAMNAERVAAKPTA
jgi:meso-butanediol dehydrogenase / (S,S)-butanediol dehydrogenase / diacetyl reductase